MAELHTARYWHVRSVGSLSDGTIPTEARAQSDRINAYHAQLSHETAVFGLADDELSLVLDTNVYLHYHQLDLIDWSVPFPGKKVRIVLPMPVLDELDEKKYDRNEKVRSAASQSIRLLRSVRGAAPPETPVPFGRFDVPLQIMLDPPRHRRRPNMDDEIVGRAEHLKIVANGEVVVGTADHGMHTRATVAGLGAWWPPDNLKRAKGAAAIEPSVLGDPSCR